MLRALWGLLTAIPRWAVLVVHEDDPELTEKQNEGLEIISVTIVVILFVLLLVAS